MWLAKWVILANPSFWLAQVLRSWVRKEPSKQREGLVAFHFWSALPNTLYGVRWCVASLAARTAFGLSVGNEGSERVLTLPTKRQNNDPNPPKGPTVMGWRLYWTEEFLQLHHQAGLWALWLGCGWANFILSRSLKRRSIPLYLAASEAVEEDGLVECTIVTSKPIRL